MTEAGHNGRGVHLDKIPVSPALQPALLALEPPPRDTLVDGRTVWIAVVAMFLGVAATFLSVALTLLIALVTNVSFHGRWSVEDATPLNHMWGAGVILVPVIGSIVVGMLARFGSESIRGHGIPEAMENILVGQSRIPARVAVLKPLSAAISIGTGGPFGAEGPIIASGGALGSMLGQLLRTSVSERKALLAAGAAAGMTATFGSPVAAALLSIELLLFEYRPRSLVPVLLAVSVAAGLRYRLEGADAFFAMPDVASPSGLSMLAYLVMGLLFGVAAWGVTRALYGMEALFERLPVHWMYWPAIGGLAVGLIGFWAPRTLGVGYANISETLSGHLAGGALALLCILKFTSWVIALASGTSGGTMAPLFTVGGGLGALVGAATAHFLPAAGVDPRIAAAVGMAAVFAGSTRALLASVVLVLETTHQPLTLGPLVAGCASAYLVSCLLLPRTLMTEKIARRKVAIPEGYAIDPLERLHVHEVMTTQVVTLRADEPISNARLWLTARSAHAQHQGFPIMSAEGHLRGVLTHRDIMGHVESDATQTVDSLLHRPPVVVFDDCVVRQAVDHMVRHGVGRLPVIARSDPGRVVGIISRSDILRIFGAHAIEGKPFRDEGRPTPSHANTARVARP
jgi:H+/Cl- antiporter ClcA/CBS domain-containing protein